MGELLMNDEWETIDVPSRTLAEMVGFGFARLGSDGIHEMTDQGREWLHLWISEQMAKFTPEEIAAAKEKIGKEK